MTGSLKLFMVLLGCKPAGRNIEQHDIFFGIGENIQDIVPEIIASWPEAKGKIHLDGWRQVTQCDGYDITVISKDTTNETQLSPKLFFINLGGYKIDEFEEFHYKMIVTATDKGLAIQQAKQTAFYRHTGYTGATSHVDDKYGIDVDDMYDITDILSPEVKDKYTILLTPANTIKADSIQLGYMKLEKL
ncbi:hypothetical protein BH11BAC3_BH11BAC3_21280 [soil metagenome]